MGQITLAKGIELEGGTVAAEHLGSHIIRGITDKEGGALSESGSSCLRLAGEPVQTGEKGGRESRTVIRRLWATENGITLTVTGDTMLGTGRGGNWNKNIFSSRIWNFFMF